MFYEIQGFGQFVGRLNSRVSLHKIRNQKTFFGCVGIFLHKRTSKMPTHF